MTDEPPPAHEILIAISALQHHLYCPRQCALIHVDGLWAENRLTVEGALLHRRVDRPGHRTRARQRATEIATDRRLERSLPLHSDRLGLTGKADTVEFPFGPDGAPAGPPRPVEYKRGRPKRHDADRVQLCAQALCLEEMLACEVPEGDLYYNAIRRRDTIEFDATLRKQTEQTIRAVRHLIEANTIPPAEYAGKCRNCSLINLCLPKGTGRSRDPRAYVHRSLDISLSCADSDP